MATKVVQGLVGALALFITAIAVEFVVGLFGAYPVPDYAVYVAAGVGFVAGACL